MHVAKHYILGVDVGRKTSLGGRLLGVLCFPYQVLRYVITGRGFFSAGRIS